MSTSFIWRPRAKMVAFVDMSLAVIIIVLAIIYAIYAALEPVVISLAKKLLEEAQKTQNPEKSGDNSGSESTAKVEVNAVKVWVVWVGVACTAALTGVHIWLGFKLLKCCDKRKTTSEAMSGARFWLIAMGILVLLGFPVHCVLLRAYWMTAVVFILRIALLAIVYKFYAELKSAMSTQVTVSKVAPI